MNDTQLEDGLRALHVQRTQLPDPLDLHERVLALPLEEITQRRSWLPRVDAGHFHAGHFQALFGAVKVAAAAVVVLFGAFIFVGILLQTSQQEPRPGVGADPSPTTSVEPSAMASDLLSSLDLAEVTPGVFRVLGDGAGHDLTTPSVLPLPRTRQVVAGPDGSVWLRSRSEHEDRLFRLGQQQTYDASRLHEFWPDLSITPEGTLWALGKGAAWVRKPTIRSCTRWPTGHGPPMRCLVASS